MSALAPFADATAGSTGLSRPDAGGRPCWYAISRPATDLSGDFFMLLPRGRDWLLVLGDVTGHGLEAAVYMLMVQEELERLADPSRSLEGIVAELHHTLLRELPGRRFASLVLIGLDGSEGIELVNAGHCPPLLRRACGVVEALAPTGPLVGALPGPRWSSRRHFLGPEDVLLLYTDGVTEATSPAGEEFGAHRLEELLGRDGHLPPQALTEKVFLDLDGFRGGRVAADDTTVLAIHGGETTGPLAPGQRQSPMSWNAAQ